MTHVQTVKIEDAEYGDIYTACIQRNGTGWLGWIQEYPKVKCEGDTKAVLLETLETMLYETLEADWEAWDKQFEEDVKAGKLDGFAEKAIADVREGRYREIEELQKFDEYMKRIQ